MGIHGLTRVIGDYAPKAIKDNEIKSYFGRKVAIDASMSIYQFLIAVRTEGNVLQNEAGETTSHLVGMFYRTLRMIDHGIKPLYVFDGKPPVMKSGELAKRLERRKEAQAALETAQETGDAENLDKFSRRTVKVTKEHNEDCKRLLRLMGVPYVEAPCEAEAQCAELCRAGKVFAAGSEDMDTLTFRSPVLLRHLTFSEARKMPISEIYLERVLEGLELTMDQFIDLCILLGCDYCDSIKGIGPMRAMQLIKEYKNLETILEKLDKTKYPVPADWPYQEARELFKNPEVTPADQLDFKWADCDEEGLIKFMVTEKGFSEERVRNGIKRLQKQKGQSTQLRLDSFFKRVAPAADSVKPGAAKTADNAKRKGAASGSAAAKKAKSGGAGARRPK